MNEQSLAVYRHREAGFAVPAPPDWLMRKDPQDKVAAIALAPAAENEFRPNIVVTVDVLDPGQTLDEWQTFAESRTAELLNDYLLLDSELLEQHGPPVFRRLAHHINPDGVALTMEQRATVRGATGYTLTMTAATLEVQRTAALFDAIALGFRTDQDIEEDER